MLPVIELEKKKGAIYLQLYRQIREHILSGRLGANSIMPSIRNLGQELGLSRTTIENAYAKLLSEGLLYSKPRSGYFVADIGEISAETVDISAIELKGGAATTDSTAVAVIYDFANHYAQLDNFDLSNWKRCLNAALHESAQMSVYGENQGELSLRRAIAGYIYNARGVLCSADQIVIGSGTQSLLHILCSILQQAGVKNACSFYGCLPKIETVFKDHAFCVEYKQFPADEIFDLQSEHIYYIRTSAHYMGSSMPISTRIKLLNAAQKNNCFILEDDFDGEFRYLMQPVPALQGMQPNNANVVYLGSFSRILPPSFRLSFMVLPLQLLPFYQKIAKFYNQTASTCEQMALCQFIKNGYLKRQIKRLRKVYSEKRQEMCQVIADVFHNKAQISSFDSGLFIILKIKTVKTAEQILNEAAKRGIKIKTLPESVDEHDVCLQLAFAGIEKSAIKPGIEAIYKICFN